MALIDDFKTRFPEFTASDVDTAWSSLEAVWPCMYGGTYGSSDCDDQAILLLIAHLFYLSTVSTSQPAMSAVSQSVGSVSVTNMIDQTGGDRKSFFNSTAYGQQFMLITSKRHGAFFV
jgi:hypothetical protein